MWLSIARVVLALLCLFMLPAFAETYTASVPVINGDVDQARREALRQIFLDAGQTGKVQVQTSSAMVNMTLSESVRWQSSFQVQGFKVVRESIEDGVLLLAADIAKQDQAVTSCPAPVLRLRNLEYQWLRPSNPLDLESETLFRLAMKQEVEKRFALSLLEGLSGKAPYVLQARLAGTHSFFSRNLKLILAFVGADGTVVGQSEYPFEHAAITADEVQNLGGAALKQKVLSEKTKQRLTEALAGAAGQFDCLPVLTVIPPRHRGGVINVTTEIDPEQPPTLVFSRTWPVQNNGRLDLLKLETFVTPTYLGKTQISLPALDAQGGILVIQ